MTCQRRPPERGEVRRNGPNIAEGVWEGEYGGDGEVDALGGYCGVGQSGRGSSGEMFLPLLPPSSP